MVTVGTRVVLGAVIAVGLLLVMAGLRGVAVFALWKRRSRSGSGADDRRLVEALAVWTEQLRDTIAGASGLEQAISVTALTAPPLLRPAVERLASRSEFIPLPDAVRDFASEVNHPLADFAAAALITASENQVREMGSLLGHLAQCCRDDVAMRTRVWVARARTRSAVRIIIVVVAVFVLGLIALDPNYLKPYATSSGSLVAVLVMGLFASAFESLRRLGNIETPSRFIARRAVTES